MKLVEMHAIIKELAAKFDGVYNYIGVRYEDKKREVGEECEWSKHNPDREDEREFPRYGSKEYDDLPELDGTSVWGIDEVYDKRITIPGVGRPLRENEFDAEHTKLFIPDHCYIVAGNRQGFHEDPDENEILIKDARVVSVIF